MIKFILEYNQHIYIKDVSLKENTTKHNTTKHNTTKHKHINQYTVRDLFIDTIDNKYSDEIYRNINKNNYYFIKENKLIHPDTYIINTNEYTINDTPKIIYIKCYRKQYGGFPGVGSITDAINDAVDALVGPILAPISIIADVFKALYKFLKWTASFLLWCWVFAVWLFTDLLNPKHFIHDFYNTIKIIIVTIFSTIFTVLMVLFKYSVNLVGGWVQGFWGWDQSSLTQKDKDSNYFQKINSNKKNKKKCYLTNTNTIPFSVILGTVLCPPIGVFMDMGLTGWMNIIICMLLTLCFYVPGLIYALIIIYS